MAALVVRISQLSMLLGLAIWTGPSLAAFSPKYCSTLNTASTSPNYDIYQSNGLCDSSCDGYAYAILQDSACWCSNFTPASSTNVDLDDCDKECPGYPDDKCGATGLFIYLFRNTNPSGTKGPSESSTPTTVSTSTKATNSASETADTIHTTDATGRNTIQTVTSFPDVPTDSSNGGVSTGAMVGVVFGVIGALGVAGLLVYFLYWKKRRGEPTSSTDPSPRSSSAGIISTMSEAGQQAGTRRGSKFIPIDDRMEFHPKIYARDPAAVPSRESADSLRDDIDYSRRVLRTTNPDPPANN